MNKQELIKHFEEMEYVSVSQMGKRTFIDLIEQLDEPQKVVVPQFVANWYEKNKHNLEFNMWDYVYLFDRQEDTSFKKWFDDSKTEPFKTLVNMHQFGYEVEKEKRYMVKMKGIEQGVNVLNHIIAEDKWCFLNRIESDQYKAKHTKKQLEDAAFGWVFKCPGIEIEEVEE